MRTSPRPTAADRWVLFGLLLLVHPLVPAVVIATSFAVGPGASDEPLLVRLIDAPAVGLVYALYLTWPGILAAAVAGGWLRCRVHWSVELALVTLAAGAALAGWYAAFFGSVDAAIALAAAALGVVWALVEVGVAGLMRRWARWRAPCAG